jgi:hypothetical protein
MAMRTLKIDSFLPRENRRFHFLEDRERHHWLLTFYARKAQVTFGVRGAKHVGVYSKIRATVSEGFLNLKSVGLVTFSSIKVYI